MASLLLTNINKVYPNGFHAVKDFNLEVADGEFVVLVGASGCGKSTTLRMVAGLEDITSGQLLIDGKDMTREPSKNRDIAMVFQNYALYGHKTVYQNMAFSLTLRGVNPDIIHEKVMNAAKLLGLTNQLNKKPRQLSGGQRQRVAVGRSIVREPKVFLFDEPLSNLDAKLRGRMRHELRMLHQTLNATMIYVTHDQIEAMTLADRIVIMEKGVTQQIGTPLEVYQNPANIHVAGFIGLPTMNFFEIEVRDGKLSNELMSLTLTKEESQILSGYEGKTIVLGLRPEHTCIDDDGELEVRVRVTENLGQNSLIHGFIGKKRVVFKLAGWLKYKEGELIKIKVTKKHFFNKETTNAIRGDN